MELDDVGHSVAVLQRPFVGEVEVDGDAEVAADDDGCWDDEVEGEHGDDERAALGFHLAPGERAGEAEGLGAVPPPAQEGTQRPEQSVEPDPQAQLLHRTHADFLTCKKKIKVLKWFSCFSRCLSTLTQYNRDRWSVFVEQLAFYAKEFHIPHFPQMARGPKGIKQDGYKT